MVVPHLSELRRRAGVISDDIATKLRLMNLEKLLPIEDHCVECGTPTDKQLYCQIECERVYAKKIGFINYVGYIVSVLFLLISFWFWLILYMFHKQHLNPELEGTDLAVDAPIRICPQCFATKRMSMARCVALLRKTKDYDRLLELYPKAGVTYAKALSI